MDFGKIFFAAVAWLCALLLAIIGIVAIRRREPMFFWAGSRVDSSEISDIAAYNRANGAMWLVFAVCFAVDGAVGLFSTTVGAIVMGVLCVPGIIVLVAVYNRIYRKYKA